MRDLPLPTPTFEPVVNAGTEDRIEVPSRSTDAMESDRIRLRIGDVAADIHERKGEVVRSRAEPVQQLQRASDELTCRARNPEVDIDRILVEHVVEQLALAAICGPSIFLQHLLDLDLVQEHLSRLAQPRRQPRLVM